MMDFSYEIIPSARKTIAIQITPEGNVQVRCPKRCSRREIHAFVESKRPWLEKHLAKLAARPVLPTLTEAELQDLARWGKEVFTERVAWYAEQMGVSYGRITIRTQHTRWGSCSSKGNLNFNCLLLLAPPEVLDYVVVHELCHRKQMNHSAAFWAEVEQVMPDYTLHRKWLKENGGSLMRRLPANS